MVQINSVFCLGSYLYMQLLIHNDGMLNLLINTKMMYINDKWIHITWQLQNGFQTCNMLSSWNMHSPSSAIVGLKISLIL